jgi:hypothetical protein
MRNLYMTLYDAPPGAVGQVARALLTPEQAAHPKFADLVDMFRGADLAMVREHREKLARAASREPAKYRRAGSTGPECAPPAGVGDRRGGQCGPEEAEKICSQKYEQSLNVSENTVWRKGISYDVDENK